MHAAPSGSTDRVWGAHPGAEPNGATRGVRLPKNQHEVVRLRFHGHHSYQEISEITGLSVGNVGFLLNAAMRNLRGMMERDDKDEKIIYLKKGVA